MAFHSNQAYLAYQELVTPLAQTGKSSAASGLLRAAWVLRLLYLGNVWKVADVKHLEPTFELICMWRRLYSVQKQMHALNSLWSILPTARGSVC